MNTLIHLKEYFRLFSVSGLRWLFTQIRPRFSSMALLAVTNITGAYLSVNFAIAIRDVIDSAVGGDMDRFIRCCILLAVIIVINVCCAGISVHLNEMISATLDREMKRNLIYKILSSEYAEISRYHSGDLVNRMNGDVGSIVTGVMILVSSCTGTLTSLVTAVVLLMDMAPMFTVAIVGITALIALFVLLIQKWMKDIHKRASAANGVVSGFFQEIIGKLLIIQGLDVSEEVGKRADAVLETRWQIHRKRKNVTLALNLGSSGLSYVGSFITLVWCAYRLCQGEMSFGELTAMTALIGHLQGPMMTLPAMIPKIINISAACERLMEIIEIPEQPAADGADGAALYERMQYIAAENLAFAYDRDPIFQNVNIHIPKGGLTVITGASGIGKSTLLKLMLGIYRPAAGRLVIQTKEEAIPVSRGVRSMFAYAPQGNLLLSGTLRENLLLSRPDATEEQIRTALYVSAMDEYVAGLPKGLDTPLGENGAGLSEGQAQRLSLARAVLTEAPVMLLDEVTSALDGETEQIVLKRICALPNKTCIAVTHRPAALSLASHQIEVSETGMTVRRMHPAQP